MRALLVLTFAVSLTGCLWQDSQTRVPPQECAATTNPAKCNEAYRR